VVGRVQRGGVALKVVRCSTTNAKVFLDLDFLNGRES
jgi:hypothetical protein